MKTIVQEHNGKQLVLSEDEYLSFKIGDKYLYTGNKDGYRVIRTEREAQLANRQILPQYYLESYGGKHLVLEIK